MSCPTSKMLKEASMAKTWPISSFVTQRRMQNYFHLPCISHYNGLTDSTYSFSFALISSNCFPVISLSDSNAIICQDILSPLLSGRLIGINQLKCQCNIACHMVYHGLFAGTSTALPLIKGCHNLGTHLRIFQFLRCHIAIYHSAGVSTFTLKISALSASLSILQNITRILVQASHLS